MEKLKSIALIISAVGLAILTLVGWLMQLVYAVNSENVVYGMYVIFLAPVAALHGALIIILGMFW